MYSDTFLLKHPVILTGITAVFLCKVNPQYVDWRIIWLYLSLEQFVNYISLVNLWYRLLSNQFIK